MSKTVIRGEFYIFDKSPGAQHREVGGTVSEEKAQMHVKNGGDVYTLFKEDAYKLATAVYSGRPVLELPHEPGFFSHYYPGGVHPDYVDKHPKAKDTPGHAFFGQRDETWKTGNNSAFRKKPKSS